MTRIRTTDASIETIPQSDREGWTEVLYHGPSFRIRRYLPSGDFSESWTPNRHTVQAACPWAAKWLMNLDRAKIDAKRGLARLEVKGSNNWTDAEREQFFAFSETLNGDANRQAA